MDDRDASPCSACADAPCCRRIPLEKLRVETRTDLRRAALLLEQRWFELGLKDDGSWILYYSRTCRRLEPLTSRCLVHGLADQPKVCRDFGASPCWYRRAFAGGESLEFIRFDQSRLRLLESLLEYDQESGEIAGVPAWEDILKLLAGQPLSDPALHAEPGAPAELWFGCPPPGTAGHLELFKFRSVFPGIRIAAGEKAWYTVAETALPAGFSDPEDLLRDYRRPAGWWL